MWQEFKKFAISGNFIDLAIAVVLGVSFGAVINSLVKDIIMPPIGMLLGGVNFSDLYINLSGTSYPSLAAAQAAGAATINYGLFLTNVINFLIIAFVLFLIVQFYNRLRKEEAATTKPCPYCQSSIPLAATRCPNCTSELAAAA